MKNDQLNFEILEIKNRSATAKIALQGAHVFEYSPLDESEVLWVSQKSFFERGRAIRGGVPICWPWFGPHASNSDFAQHGFVRTAMFRIKEQFDRDAYESVVILELIQTPEMREQFDYEYRLEVKVSVGERLCIELITTNLGTQSFEITAALHSYFRVSDIANIQLRGLDNTPFFDSLEVCEKVQIGDIGVSQEIDRVYQEVQWPLTLVDMHRDIIIDAENSNSVVVWNPWIEKSSKMRDMAVDGYKQMFCIETANAKKDAKTLALGECHTLCCIITQKVRT
jgi:glucose-6-phosphate 1-epimerase